MRANHQQFHLIVERLDASVAGRAVPGRAGHGVLQPPALAIPPTPVWLVPRAGRLPSLFGARTRKAGGGFLVEPLMQGRQLRLLLVCTGKRRLRVNGLVAPPLLVLKEKDNVQLNEKVLLHVTIYSRPLIGPVPAAFVGKECPVCRVPFSQGTRGYQCSCGSVMHCESDAMEDGLQCAQLRARSGCSACQKPVVLSPGYDYLPEFGGGDE